MNTRRRDVLGTLAMGLSTPVIAAAAAAAQSDAGASEVTGIGDGKNTVAILNDTHIAEQHGDDHAHPRNLRLAIEQIRALAPRPAAVIVNGDLAMSTGTPGDYHHFGQLIKPLRQELPVYLTLGNHDTRAEFLRAFPDLRSASQLPEHRHTGMCCLTRSRTRPPPPAGSAMIKFAGCLNRPTLQARADRSYLSPTTTPASAAMRCIFPGVSRTPMRSGRNWLLGPR